MIPDNNLIDSLKKEKKRFDDIADKNRKNIFIAREAANTAFLAKLNGNETTESIKPDKTKFTATLQKVEVVRGSLDDVIGVKLTWQ